MIGYGFILDFLKSNVRVRGIHFLIF